MTAKELRSLGVTVGCSEVARMLGWDVQAVQRAMRKGTIPAKKVGSKRWVMSTKAACEMCGIEWPIE